MKIINKRFYLSGAMVAMVGALAVGCVENQAIREMNYAHRDNNISSSL